MYKIPGSIEHCCPAIDENGIIYIGTIHDAANGNHLYAFYPNGTIRWKFYTGGDISSSPVIGEDGTIYFGHGGGPNDGHINAVYPNGTLRWRFNASHAIYSSPAIGLDGTIYCGSHDTYIYALYPDDGTLKWKFKTGNWVHGSPTIADDGTIYIGSDDMYLYALYPNGTLRWKTKIGEIFGSVALDKDGTIYAGVWEKRFYALYPNGTVNWSFDLGNSKIWGSSPALSDDGTIYFGTCDLEWTGGIDLIALNTDSTLKWRNRLDTVFSSPAIAEDGIVYIGSCGGDEGYLNAFGKLDPDAPSAPIITGQTSGIAGTEYEYTFESTSPLGKDVYYYIEWGDGSKKDWFGPFSSGEDITVNHTWSEQGTYTIRARAKDTENLWGPWGELQVTMPRYKVMSSSLLLRLLERFPLLEVILSKIINL
jgi:outer membrane protein assembly factor BamB